MGAFNQAGNVSGVAVPLEALAPDSANVTAVSNIVVDANPLRKSLVVINTGEANVYFGIGVAASIGAGLMLTPYGTWVMDAYTFSTEAIYGVASSASSISIQEYN